MLRPRPPCLLGLFLVLSLGLPSAAEETRSSVTVDARELSVPGLVMRHPEAVVGPLKAPDPRGRGILVVGRGPQPDIHLVPWEGSPKLMEELRLPSGDFGKPQLIRPWPGGLAVRYRRGDFTLYDQAFKLVAKVDSRVNCAFGLTQTPKARLCIGSPIVAPPGEQAAWDDFSWRRRHARKDCRFFKVALDGPQELQVPLICDPRLDSPTGHILQAGDLVSSLDASRHFVVLEGLPALTVLNSNGDILHAATYLEPGEDFAELSAEDETAQYQSATAAMEVRRKVRWFRGLARWPEEIGLVFQIWDGSRLSFELDVFNLEGEKLANDLRLSLGNLEDNSFVQPLNFPDGRVLLSVTDRKLGNREILDQRIYQLHLERPEAANRSDNLPLVPLRGNTTARLRFTFEAAPAADVPFAYRLENAIDGPSGEYLDARADPQGTFEVADLGAGDFLRLVVEDPRFAYLQQRLAAGEHSIELLPGRSVTGRVSDPENRPLAGVLVRGLAAVKGDPKRRGSLQVETDAAGRYQLAGLPAERCFFTWSHADLATHRRWIDLSSDQEIDVTLDRGRTVAVRVESNDRAFLPEGDSRGIAGATVREPESSQTWITNQEGEAMLRGLPSDRPLSFEVEAENHLPGKVALPDGDRELRVVLEEGGALVFQVMDATGGTAIEEVTLGWRQRRVHRRRTVHGHDGRFVAGGFHPGSLELSLEADGFRPTRFELELGSGEVDLGTLLLDPGAVIEGELWNRATDQPVAGALLVFPRRSTQGTMAARHFRRVHTASTDAQGHFRLGGLSPGSVCAEIQHPDLPASALEVRDLGASEQRYLGPVLLAGGRRVHGRLVDAAGDGLPSTTVELRAADLYNPCLRQITQSDADGYFELPRVAPGRYFAAVRGKQRLLAAKELEVKHAALDAGEIRVAQRRFAGRVSINGVPAAGGVLTFEAGGSGFRPTPVFVAYRGPGAGRQQRLINDLGALFGTGVDGEGQYATSQVFPAREAVVTYRPADNAAEFRRKVEVPAAADDSSDFADAITLDFDFVGENLAGHVLDAENRPLVGAGVELTRAGLAVRSTRSGSEGEFLLPAAPPGPVEVRARLDDLRGALLSPEVEVARQDSFLELVLLPEAERQVVAEVTDLEGRPLPHALGLLTDGDAVAMVRPADVAGRLRFAGLVPGRYKLVVACGTGLMEGPEMDLRSSRQPFADAPAVNLECGPAIHNDVELGSERASRRTALLTSDGYPLAPLLGYLGRALVSDPLGRLSLPPLAPSRWYLDLLDGTPSKRLWLDAEAEQIDLR